MMTEHSYDVCIIGLGPAGLGAIHELSESGLASRTLCLDSGVAAEHRRCQIINGETCELESPCQMTSGVGGCSVLASGKISEFPAGSGLAAVLGSEESAKKKLRQALQVLARSLPLQETELSCSPNIAKKRFKELGFQYRFYPIKTFRQDQIVEACSNFVSQAQSSGMSIMLGTEVTKVENDGKCYRLIARNHEQEIVISAKRVILAVGRSGQQLLESLRESIGLHSDEYHLDAGVRLEFPTESFPSIDESHKDLKLIFGDARTFCVCKNGRVAPYRSSDIFLLEGYYNPAFQSGFTNLSIMVRMEPSKRNLDIFREIQERVRNLSGGRTVRQLLPDYLDMKKERTLLDPPSSTRFWQWGDVGSCFPMDLSARIMKAVDVFVSRLLPRDQWQRSSVFAPEVDCRLILPIQAGFRLLPGLYAAGDCTGRFRGILQAFCSGIECARILIGDCNGKH